MSLINDVLRDMDKRQASVSGPANAPAPLVAPEPRRKKWPPSWVFLLITGSSLGALGVLLVQNQILPRSQPSQVVVSAEAPPAHASVDVTVLSVTPKPAAETLAQAADAPVSDAVTSVAEQDLGSHGKQGEASSITTTPASTDPIPHQVRESGTAERQENLPSSGAHEIEQQTDTPQQPAEALMPTGQHEPAVPTPSPGSLAAPVTVYLPPDTRVNLRAAPSTASRVLDVLDQTHALTLLESVNNFHHVALADGRSGWVSQQFSSLTPYRSSVQTPGNAPGASSPPPAQTRPSPSPALTPDALYRQALQALERRDAAAAETALHRVLANNPSHRGALETLVSLLLRQNRHPELEALLGTLSTPHARQLQARLLVERGEHRQALAVLDSIAPADRDSTTLATLGALQQLAGQHHDAVLSFRQALGRGNTQAGTFAGLAISLEALDQLTEARQAWQAVLESPNADPALTAHARNRLGVAPATGERR